MVTADDLDLQAAMKLIRPAPPLPKPTGPVVHVRSADQLRRAVWRAGPGTTILLADGTYYLRRELVINQDRLVLRGAGGDREKVILDGARSPSETIVTLLRTDRVTIADLTVRNCFGHGICVRAEWSNQRTQIHNVKLQNLWKRHVKGTCPRGARGQWNPDGNDPHARKIRPTGGSIRHCLFVQDIRKRWTDWADGDYVGGIDMMWLKDWTIADNLFVGIRGRNGGGRGAIFVWNNSQGVVAERNVFIDCDRSICYGNPSGGPLHMTGGIIRNNFIVGGASRAVELVRTRGCKMHNNSVYGTRFRDHTVHVFQGAEGGRLFNNLIHGRAVIEPAAASGHNIIGNLDGWFVDPATGDLHLTPAARAAFAAGATLREVTEDFDGVKRKSPPDVGASEFRPRPRRSGRA